MRSHCVRCEIHACRFLRVCRRRGSNRLVEWLAVCSRRGLGHLLHVQTPYLWVQHQVQEGDLRLKKEPGDRNASDALTKPLDAKRMTKLVTAMGFEFRGGRTSFAPEARWPYVTVEKCEIVFTTMNFNNGLVFGKTRESHSARACPRVWLVGCRSSSIRKSGFETGSDTALNFFFLSVKGVLTYLSVTGQV